MGKILTTIKKLLSELINRAMQYSKHFPILIFAFGAIIFVIAKTYLVVAPINYREQPIEVDDAYSYIAQAVIFEDCFDGNCKTLTSLADQVAGNSDIDSVSAHRFKTELSLMRYYHPLYSTIFNTFRAMGFDLSQIYSGISISFSIVLFMSISYWLYLLWGPAASGFALLLASIYVFPGQGLNAIVPSNMAFTFAVISWIALLKKNPSVVLISVLWLLGLLMHNLFVYYLLFGIIFLLLNSTPPNGRSQKLLLQIGILLLLVKIAVSLMVPEFTLITDFSKYYTEVPTLFDNIILHTKFLLLMPTQWLGSFENTAIGTLIFVIGIFSIPKPRAKIIIPIIILLALIYASSIIYFNPGQGNDLGPRLWVPLLLMCFGVIGNFVENLALALIYWVKELNSKKQSLLSRSTIFTNRGWKFIAMILLAIIFARGFANYYEFSSDNYRFKLDQRKTRQDYSFTDFEFNGFIGQIDSSESILFLDEIPLFVAISEGLLENEVVYYQVIQDTEKMDSWLDQNENIRYVMGMHPIEDLGFHRKGGFQLDSKMLLTITNENFSAYESIQLLIENPNDQVIKIMFEPQFEKISLLPQSNDWHSVSLNTQNLNEISLSVLTPNSSIIVRGIKVNSAASDHWPWDQGFSLVLESTNGDATAVKISLNLDDISQILQKDLKVISDRSSILLLEVVDE